jgi:hypothetical protein
MPKKKKLNKSLIIYILLGLLIALLIKNNSKKDYWSGVYYPDGSSSNPIYSHHFDSKEECIGWAVNERGKRPQDSKVDIQDLWECNKNCKLESNYLYLVSNHPESILQDNSGPLYLCEDGGFDGGDWLRGDF